MRLRSKREGSMMERHLLPGSLSRPNRKRFLIEIEHSGAKMLVGISVVCLIFQIESWRSKAPAMWSSGTMAFAAPRWIASFGMPNTTHVSSL